MRGRNLAIVAIFLMGSGNNVQSIKQGLASNTNQTQKESTFVALESEAKEEVEAGEEFIGNLFWKFGDLVTGGKLESGYKKDLSAYPIEENACPIGYHYNPKKDKENVDKKGRRMHFTDTAIFHKTRKEVRAERDRPKSYCDKDEKPAAPKKVEVKKVLAVKPVNTTEPAEEAEKETEAANGTIPMKNATAGANATAASPAKGAAPVDAKPVDAAPAEKPVAPTGPVAPAPGPPTEPPVVPEKKPVTTPPKMEEKPEKAPGPKTKDLPKKEKKLTDEEEELKKEKKDWEERQKEA